jgi:hypothetical protein
MVVRISGSGGGSGGALADHTHSAPGDGGATVDADLVTGHTFVSAGVQSSTSGTLRIWDGSSAFRHSITVPTAGLTDDRSFKLNDINGDIFVVGNASSPATVAGTMARVNTVGIAAPIGTTVLAKTCPIGAYMINAYILKTLAGAGAIGLNLTWTDSTGAITKTGIISIVGGAAAGSVSHVTIPIYKSSTADVTWALTLTGRTTDTYSLRIRCSYMGP